jgi:hypothetical protein
MAWNKHAASRNRPKMGDFRQKFSPFRGYIGGGDWGAVTKLAWLRLNQGSNETTRKEIRPDENSRHNGRLRSYSQKRVPPRGSACYQGATKPV